MAGVKVQVEIDASKLGAQLGKLEHATKDLAAFWRDVGEYLQVRAQDRFKAEQDPEGKKWVALSPAYRRRKKGPKILTEEGRLRRLAPHPTADGVEFGTNVKYAAIHQFGGEVKLPERSQVLLFRKSGRFMSHRAAEKAKTPMRIAFAKTGPRRVKIPARPYLGLSAADREEIVTLLSEHLARALGSG